MSAKSEKPESATGDYTPGKTKLPDPGDALEVKREADAAVRKARREYVGTEAVRPAEAGGDR